MTRLQLARVASCAVAERLNRIRKDTSSPLELVRFGCRTRDLLVTMPILLKQSESIVSDNDDSIREAIEIVSYFCCFN